MLWQLIFMKVVITFMPDSIPRFVADLFVEGCTVLADTEKMFDSILVKCIYKYFSYIEFYTQFQTFHTWNKFSSKSHKSMYQVEILNGFVDVYHLLAELSWRLLCLWCREAKMLLLWSGVFFIQCLLYTAIETTDFTAQTKYFCIIDCRISTCFLYQVA